MSIFTKKKKKKPEISQPSNFEHFQHTEIDPESGKYEGLPVQWKSVLGYDTTHTNDHGPVEGHVQAKNAFGLNLEKQPSELDLQLEGEVNTNLGHENGNLPQTINTEVVSTVMQYSTSPQLTGNFQRERNGSLRKKVPSWPLDKRSSQQDWKKRFTETNLNPPRDELEDSTPENVHIEIMRPLVNKIDEFDKLLIHIAEESKRHDAKADKLAMKLTEKCVYNSNKNEAKFTEVLKKLDDLGEEIKILKSEWQTESLKIKANQENTPALLLKFQEKITTDITQAMQDMQDKQLTEQLKIKKEILDEINRRMDAFDGKMSAHISDTDTNPKQLTEALESMQTLLSQLMHDVNVQGQSHRAALETISMMYAEVGGKFREVQEHVADQIKAVCKSEREQTLKALEEKNKQVSAQFQHQISQPIREVRNQQEENNQQLQQIITENQELKREFRILRNELLQQREPRLNDQVVRIEDNPPLGVCSQHQQAICQEGEHHEPPVPRGSCIIFSVEAEQLGDEDDDEQDCRSTDSCRRYDRSGDTNNGAAAENVIMVPPGGHFHLTDYQDSLSTENYTEWKLDPHSRAGNAVRIILHGCKSLIKDLLERLESHQTSRSRTWEDLLTILCCFRINLAHGCIIMHCYPKSVKDAKILYSNLRNGHVAAGLRQLLMTTEVLREADDDVKKTTLDVVAIQQDFLDVIQELEKCEESDGDSTSTEVVDSSALLTDGALCVAKSTPQLVDVTDQDSLQILLDQSQSYPTRCTTVSLEIDMEIDEGKLLALFDYMKANISGIGKRLQCPMKGVRWGCIILDLEIDSIGEIQKLLHRHKTGEILQIIKEIAGPVIGNTDSLQVSILHDSSSVIKESGSFGSTYTDAGDAGSADLSDSSTNCVTSSMPEPIVIVTGHSPQPVKNVVGRDSILEKIHVTYKACKQDIIEDVSKETLIQILTGVGGIGKTEVAIQYAYRYHRDYPSGLYWINAATMTALDHGFSTMLQELDLEVTIDNDNMCVTADQTKCQILQWLEAHPGWLLILDDVTNLELIKHYFPVFPSKGHIIITTRLVDFRKMVSVEAEELPIHPLSNAAAMKLLLICTQGISPKEVYLTLRRMEEEDGQNYLAFKQFSDDLHGQPLSIMMAGSFMRKNLAKEENKNLYQHFWSQPITLQLCQLKDYNQFLGNVDEKLMCFGSDLQTDSDVFDPDKEDDETSLCFQIPSQHHFTSAWKLISDQLESRTDGPAAMELLQLMSYLSPTISKSLLISTSQQLKSSHLKTAMIEHPHIDSSHQDYRPVEMKVSHLVTILCEHHLAMKSYGTTSFTVPRIIQDIIRQKLERKMMRRITAVNDAIQVLRANFPTISDMVGMTSPLAFTQQEVIVHTSILHTHLTKSFIEEAKVEIEDPTSLLNDVGYYLRMMAKQPQAAVPIFETALHIAEVLLTLKPEREHHKELSKAHYNLGSAYFDVSRVKDALREQEKGKEFMQSSGMYDIGQVERELFDAIQNQDEDTILELLPCVNINAVSAEGLTFLHQAAIYNVSSFISHVQNYHDISLLICSIVDCKKSEFFNMKAIDISRKSFSEKLRVAIQIEESFSELHKVARQGGVEKLRELVQNMGNVDVLAHCDLTPLHVACGVGSLGNVKLLIQKGADVRREMSDAVTVLQKAVMYNHVEVVAYLLSRSEVRELIHHQDQKLNTVLHIGVKLNKGSQLVQLLLDKGACINAPNAKGYTPVHVAVISRRVENLKVLLQNNADIQTRDGKHWQAIHYAAESGHVDIIKVLLNHASRHHGVEEIANANCVLDCSNSVCLVKGKQNCKDVWHYVRVDVSKRPLFLNSWKSKTPLDVADFGKVLKSGWGSNPEPGVFQSIKKEYEEGDLDKIKQVTPLHLAARNAHIEAIKVLVREGGASVSAEDDRQQTPVHSAVLSGKLISVKTLVEELGADPNTEDSEGNTPEYLAKLNELHDIEQWFVNEAIKYTTPQNSSSPNVVEVSASYKDAMPQASSDIPIVVKDEQIMSASGGATPEPVHGKGYERGLVAYDKCLNRSSSKEGDSDSSSPYEDDIKGDHEIENFEKLKMSVNAKNAICHRDQSDQSGKSSCMPSTVM
ncbi:uncharacterized protein LOC144434204 [Glandiceps talaboti]